MSKSLKSIYIIVAILLITLFFTIIIIFKNNNNYENDENNNTANEIEINELESINITEEEGVETDSSQTPFQVTNGAHFYTVQECINKYITSMKELKKQDTEENRESLYKKLTDNYIKENNITLDNVKNISIREDSAFVGVIKMLQLNINENHITRYAVRTLFFDSNYKIYYFNFIVYLDYGNSTFAIEPVGGDNADLSKIDLATEIEDIDANDYNQYQYNVMTKSSIVSRYVGFFKTLCYSSPDIAYSYLSDDFKAKQYPSVDGFKKFLANNQEKIKYMQVMNCEDITNQEDSTRYICSNVGGGYITIYENAIMDFKIELNI